jgi:hypothetical protein
MKALAMVISLAFALTSACSHMGSTPSLPNAANELLRGQQPDVRQEVRSAVQKNAPAEVVGALDDAQAVQQGGVDAAPHQLSKHGVPVDPGSLENAVKQVKRLKR